MVGCGTARLRFLISKPFGGARVGEITRQNTDGRRTVESTRGVCPPTSSSSTTEVDEDESKHSLSLDVDDDEYGQGEQPNACWRLWCDLV